MAKKAYVGVSNKARRVKKIYIGISGKARKVRKGYIGIANKARLFFTHGTLKYHADYVNCTTANLRIAAASNDNYAYISDGEAVNSFDKDLVCSTASSLSAKRYACEGANAAGQYALFGGDNGVMSSSDTSVDAYSKTGTRTSATAFAEKLSDYRAGRNDNYAIFGPSGTYCYATMYDASLTQTIVSTSGHDSKYCIADNGAYAIVYSGGYYSNYDNLYHELPYVDAINTSGTVTALDDLALSHGRMYAIGVRAGGYAVCAGGYVEGIDVQSGNKTHLFFTNVTAYNLSLTKSSAPSLSNVTSTNVVGELLGATGDENFGIIPTRTANSANWSGYYEAYDSSLVKQVYNKTGNSVAERITPVAVSFKQYAMFFKGEGNTSDQRRSVDVFEVD